MAIYLEMDGLNKQWVKMTREIDAIYVWDRLESAKKADRRVYMAAHKGSPSVSVVSAAFTETDANQIQNDTGIPDANLISLNHDFHVADSVDRLLKGMHVWNDPHKEMTSSRLSDPNPQHPSPHPSPIPYTSGERATQAETGAVRDAIAGKVDTTLVPYELILAAAIGLNYGTQKYEARNFEKGLGARVLLGSIERHCRAIMNGEYTDMDSKLPHYVLLTSSVAMFVSNVMRGTVIEDLPPPAIYADMGYTQDLAAMSELARSIELAGMIDRQASAASNIAEENQLALGV